MVEVIITETAWSDLESIRRYIEIDSERYAEMFVQKFFTYIEILHLLPRAGRIVPEYDVETLRELIYGNYRIVYKITNIDSISIVRVVNGAKLLEI